MSCDNCEFEDKDTDEYPCTQCTRNPEYFDNYIEQEVRSNGSNY